MDAIEQLREQRASIWNEMEALMARADDENRDLTADERTEYDRLEARYNDNGEALSHAERREQMRNQARASAMQQPRNNDDPEAHRATSLGQHFVDTVGERIHEVRATGSRFSVTAPEFRNAATDTQVTGGSSGDLAPLLTQVDSNIVEGFRRRLTIADLLDSGTLTGAAITYFVEGALEGDFTTVAENGQKPQLHYADPTPVTEALKKIAGFIKESTEMVEDLPFLVSAINNRLLYNLGLFEEDQVLSGDGTGTNIKGLMNRTGVQALGATTDTKAGNADQVFKAMTNVNTATGLDADGVVINPTDYQTFRLNKDGNGQYFGGGYFSGEYGVGGVPIQPPLWGLRTVVTPAIAAGTVLVGAFKQAGTLYRKGGVRVEATNSNEDDFTNNRVTIRAEERVALAVRVPSAMVKLTLGTA